MNHSSERQSPRRLDGLVVPLQQPLGVGEGAVLLGVRGGGQEEDLGGDVLGAQLAGLDLRRVVQNAAVSISTRSRTTSQSSCASAVPLQPAVGRADRRVLAHDEVALDRRRRPCPRSVG